FEPGSMTPESCEVTYCDETMTLDVNDALAHCYSSNRDIVSKQGEDLASPTCPTFLMPACGQWVFHGDHTIADDTIGSILGTFDHAKGPLAPRSNLGAPAFNGWPQWSS